MDMSGNVTTLHMFAKRVLDSIQHTDHMDAGESHYAQVFRGYFHGLQLICIWFAMRGMFDCNPVVMPYDLQLSVKQPY
jgi:hypothetical protein